MIAKHSPDGQNPGLSELESSNERLKLPKIESVRTGFRFLDFFVLFICLSGILFFVYLFRQDLFQTIRLQNVQPVGFVSLKSNVVQRRIANRVLWDRLLNESSVYVGDIIRVAELSSATLNIEGQQVHLNENTFIRIQRSADGESLQIELSEGSMSVSTGEEGSALQLALMGHVVEPSSGSVLNIAAGNDGIVVKVSEGAALLVDESRESREISTASMVVFDTAGTERRVPAVVVTHPRSNARFLKSTAAPLPVSFEWNRINLEPEDSLRLEIAEDRNFNRVIRTIDGLGDKGSSLLDSGVWYWRLSFLDEVLSSGRIVVVETSAPELISPIMDSSIRYQNDLPPVRFQWSEANGASNYLLEVSLLPDFSNIQIIQETSATSFNTQEMGQGTWYWRVTPVYASGFEGGASLSAVSHFRVEQSAQTASAVNDIVLPEPPPVPLELRLISPEDGTGIAGLSALRSGAAFRWDSDRNTASVRFVLSQNSDPLQQPSIEINNPGRTVQVNRIDIGTWYWTVEARSVEGLVSSAPPRQLQVLPIPLLQAPGNLQPPNGYQVEIEAIKARQTINFSWQAVNGANAYIVTLYERTSSGREQIFRSTPQNRTRWTLDDINLLSRNTFYWQVEAVNVNQNGVVEQSGMLSENYFIVEFPLPEVQLIRPGVLYGQ